MVLAPCERHVAGIVCGGASGRHDYRDSGGLSSTEILQRTSGNYAMGVFYSVFTIAAAVHSSIGLRTVAFEVLGWRGASVNLILTVFFLMLCVTGISAVGGLVL
ncbi:hypothetical protein [Marinobacterium aestuariivivens]|uniref:hypothetical protein n=1 Tax=Marinobacterium aestuariivivens TaxID=1698799 RepID=UPI0036D2E2EA